MRLAVTALAILVVAAPAVGERLVVHDPMLQDVCPSGPTWKAVSACINRQVKPTLVRELPGARLVQMPDDHMFHGIYLYVEGAKGVWRIVGFAREDKPELIAFERFERGGYRFEIGTVTQIAVESSPTSLALLKHKITTVCPKETCFTAVLACDVLVRGKAYWSYRGHQIVAGDTLRFVGERSNAGTVCNIRDQEFSLPP